jgi:hypothetical protein
MIHPTGGCDAIPYDGWTFPTRAMDSRKYPRTFHLPFSPGTTSDDRIATDISSLFNEPVVITEKLDGENTCLNRFGVFARSHVAPTRNPWASYLQERWQLLRHDLGDLELFGESLYAVHSIEYTGLDAHFFLFAIREGDRWLSWDEVVSYAGVLDLPTVPVLFRGEVTETSFRERIEELVAQPSAKSDPLLEASRREGVVVRVARELRADEFATHVFKWVRKGHVQTTEHWSRNWRRAPLAHELRRMRGAAS